MATRGFRPTFSLGLFIGVLLSVAAFIAGVYLSADIIAAGSKMLIGKSDFAENTPANPFDLRIVRHKNKDNKYEVFLFDPGQNDAVRRINRDLTIEIVNDPAYKTESLVSKPDEAASEVIGLLKRRTETEAAKRKLLHTDSATTDSGKEGAAQEAGGAQASPGQPPKQ